MTDNAMFHQLLDDLSKYFFSNINSDSFNQIVFLKSFKFVLVILTEKKVFLAIRELFSDNTIDTVILFCSLIVVFFILK